MKRITLLFISVICLFILACSDAENFKVLKQTTGPYQTNCYLVYATE